MEPRFQRPVFHSISVEYVIKCTKKYTYNLQKKLFFTKIQAFLYATVYTAARNLAEINRNRLSEPGQPPMLPAGLCGSLVTEEQVEWWSAVCNVYRNKAK
jgi:hypothetical protein